MANYIFTNKAVEDLSKIWNYTFKVWSETQADRYYPMLVDSCQELAEDTLSGKNYFEVEKDLPGLKVCEHIIFYKKL